MSQQEPTNAEIAFGAAAVEEIEVDDPAYLATLDIGCLGCMLQAKLAGRISEELYDSIMAEIAAIEKQGKGTCPKCGNTTYVSMYEPSMAHCPVCGLYSAMARESDGGVVWVPMRQGWTQQRYREWAQEVSSDVAAEEGRGS